MLIKAFSPLLLILFFFINSGFAQEIFNGGDFSNGANWTGGSKPDPNADIEIAAGASMNVDESYTCHSLTINEFSSFSCSGGSILTIGTGGIYDENGNKIIDINSSLQISSSIEVNPNGTFTDARDGHVYNWVKIGNQVWMAENLAYLVSVSPSANGSETDPYYYVYGYEGTVVDDAKATKNFNTYGALYNWPAAMAEAASSPANPSGVQGACPAGWHLPSDAEWTELKDFLTADGHSGTEGTALKSTSGWESGSNGTDDYGFTGLPCGFRSIGGFFAIVECDWWSSTVGNSIVWSWFLGSNTTFLQLTSRKDLGFSIRCVRD